MCQTGAPRCYTESRKAADKAAAAYAEATTGMSGLLARTGIGQADNRVAQAEAAYLDALGELAASPRGIAEITDSRAQDARTGAFVDAHVDEVLAAGRYRRRRGDIVRRLAAADEDAQGTLVDPETPVDAVVSQATVAFAAQYRDHNEAVHVPGVKTYHDKTAQAQGVARWLTKVNDQAKVYKTAVRHAAHAEEDLRLIGRSVDASGSRTDQRRLADAQVAADEQAANLRRERTRLVLMADSLRMAQEQEAPDDQYVSMRPRRTSVTQPEDDSQQRLRRQQQDRDEAQRRTQQGAAMTAGLWTSGVFG